MAALTMYEGIVGDFYSSEAIHEHPSLVDAFMKNPRAEEGSTAKKGNWWLMVQHKRHGFHQKVQRRTLHSNMVIVHPQCGRYILRGLNGHKVNCRRREERGGRREEGGVVYMSKWVEAVHRAFCSFTWCVDRRIPCVVVDDARGHTG